MVVLPVVSLTWKHLKWLLRTNSTIQGLKILASREPLAIWYTWSYQRLCWSSSFFWSSFHWWCTTMFLRWVMSLSIYFVNISTKHAHKQLLVTTDHNRLLLDLSYLFCGDFLWLGMKRSLGLGIPLSCNSSGLSVIWLVIISWDAWVLKLVCVCQTYYLLGACPAWPWLQHWNLSFFWSPHLILQMGSPHLAVSFLWHISGHSCFLTYLPTYLWRTDFE